MHTHRQTQASTRKLKTALALGAIALTAALWTVPAEAGNGGTSGSASHAPKGKAKLRHGKAIPPSDAPRRVVQVIRAANKIRNKPYKYGGGHGRWRDRGYDCSGAISYALHGGRLLRSPLTSSGFMHWARRGKGKWITVYSNPGHAFMVVAGLRFDTSQTAGNGPGWSKRMVSKRGYKVRHKARY